MEALTSLTVFSGAMLFGSYIAGSVPLLCNLSESRLRLVSIFGAGLLIGTALSVIVPEGVEALYNAQHDALHHDNLRRVQMPAQDSPALTSESRRSVSGSDVNGSITESRREKRHVHAGGRGKGEGVHQKIGFSLVAGFVFMLLVDQISNTAITNDRAGRSRLGISATIGLVVHAAADGIALGSASTINKSDVQLIVFVAIMLHKAPAAFGLVSFLLIEGIDHRTIRKHLLVFSLAAPLGALITFFAILNSGETLSASESNTGVLMLFSAGTFLYVATVHVLPELANQPMSSSVYSLVVDVQSPSSLGHSHSSGNRFSLKELASIIAGVVVPALLTVTPSL